MLKDKFIVLGVTGSIAIYKSLHLIRLLKKAGANVQVIMTKSACEFITPYFPGNITKSRYYGYV